MGNEIQAIGTSLEVQGTPGKVSEKYLTKLDALLQEMKGKSLVMIIENGLAYEVRLNRENGKLALQLKQISEDRVQSFTNEKVGIYNRTHNVWTSSLSVTGHIVVAAVGIFGSQGAGIAAKNIIDILDKGNDGLSRGLQTRDEGDRTKVDYQREIYQTSGSEHRQGVSQTSQMHREMDGMFDRAQNVASELFRTLYST